MDVLKNISSYYMNRVFLHIHHKHSVNTLHQSTFPVELPIPQLYAEVFSKAE